MRKAFAPFAVLALFLGGMILASIAAQLHLFGPHSYSRISPVQSELSTTKSLLDNFDLDCGRYPTTEEGLAALRYAPKGLEKKWKGPYGSKPIVIDPYGNPYVYTSSGKAEFHLISYGADGKPGGDGDDADIVVNE